MVTTESVFQNLQDEELMTAFNEYEIWRKTGILQDGIIRSVHKEVETTNETSVLLNTLIEPLLYVLILRLL